MDYILIAYNITALLLGMIVATSIRQHIKAKSRFHALEQIMRDARSEG